LLASRLASLSLSVAGVVRSRTGPVTCFADARQNLPSGYIGEYLVENHEIGVLVMKLTEPVAAARCLEHRVAIPRQEYRYKSADVRLAHDDKHGKLAQRFTKWRSVHVSRA
jgi:hypothetical protein